LQSVSGEDSRGFSHQPNLELTRHTDALMVPTLLVVAVTTIVARRLGAPSIYSARLGSGQARQSSESPGSSTPDVIDALNETPALEVSPPDERAHRSALRDP
jgi:hypothetical protein